MQDISELSKQRKFVCLWKKHQSTMFQHIVCVCVFMCLKKKKKSRCFYLRLQTIKFYISRVFESSIVSILYHAWVHCFIALFNFNFTLEIEEMQIESKTEFEKKIRDMNWNFPVLEQKHNNERKTEDIFFYWW